LKEDHALIKTEDRLSRNLDDVDFTEGINAEVVRLASSRVSEIKKSTIDDFQLSFDFG